MSLRPPRPRPAPLTALRAFEAAARLGGFMRAAEELGVSAGAVAQQVKTLEAWCGAALFTRSARGVTLTPLGAAALSDLSAGFDRLSGASMRLRSGGVGHDIRIAALPSVAQLWLAPRLPAIRRRSPTATISVTALEAPPPLNRGEFHMALFYGAAPAAGRIVEIERDAITPVCAPALAKSIRGEADLARHPRITDAAWRDDWRIWEAETGIAGGAEGPEFSLYALGVEEAARGAGVLMGRPALLAPQLASGALVAPFARVVEMPGALTLSLAPDVDAGSASGAASEVAASVAAALIG